MVVQRVAKSVKFGVTKIPVIGLVVALYDQVFYPNTQLRVCAVTVHCVSAFARRLNDLIVARIDDVEVVPGAACQHVTGGDPPIKPGNAAVQSVISDQAVQAIPAAANGQNVVQSISSAG